MLVARTDLCVAGQEETFVVDDPVKHLQINRRNKTGMMYMLFLNKELTPLRCNS